MISQYRGITIENRRTAQRTVMRSERNIGKHYLQVVWNSCHSFSVSQPPETSFWGLSPCLNSKHCSGSVSSFTQLSQSLLLFNCSAYYLCYNNFTAIVKSGLQAQLAGCLQFANFAAFCKFANQNKDDRNIFLWYDKLVKTTTNH